MISKTIMDAFDDMIELHRQAANVALSLARRVSELEAKVRELEDKGKNKKNG